MEKMLCSKQKQFKALVICMALVIMALPLSGVAVGETLEADISGITYTPVTDAEANDLTFQWTRDNEVIEGETSEIYVLSEADVGRRIRVIVTADGENAVGSVESDATPQVAVRLTVVNGTGSGIDNAGQEVHITADPPPEGQAFAGWTWTGDEEGLIPNPTNPNAILTMPARSVTVTATYEDDDGPEEDL